MKAAEMRQKSVQEIKQELLERYKELFNLKMQRGMGQLAKPHLFKQVKKDIARLKTILREKAGEA